MTEAQQRPAGRLLGAAQRLRGACARLPRLVWAVWAGAWMGLIWWLSSFGSDRPNWVPDLPNFWVNFAHAAVFGGLAYWVSFAMPRDAGVPRLHSWRAAAVVAVTVAYGIVDEWHQASVPGRHPTFFDVLTDAVGATCTVWVIAYAGKAAATERGFAGRVALSLWMCVGSAWIATAFHTRWPEPLWF